MSLQFRQPVENLDLWSASGADISFVITFASPTGPGFCGRRGFLASWRPLYSSKGAVEITGSPFSTLADAEEAEGAYAPLTRIDEQRALARGALERW